MTAPALDKMLIARNFSAASARYETWALAQAAIAAGLARRLPAGAAPARIVDLGCGTGLLSARLLERFPEAQLTGLDLAPGMIEHCRRLWAGVDRARFIAGDAEDARLVIPGCDLLAGSCTLQWFAQPAETLRRWVRALSPRGHVALAVLVEGSFPELDEACRAALGAPYRGLLLPPPAFAADILRGEGLRVLTDDGEDIAAEYAGAYEALRSFRNIGARLQGHPGRTLLGITDTRRLLEAYGRAARTREHVTVTYRVRYVVGEKSP